jgi:hypothetical protein
MEAVLEHRLCVRCALVMKSFSTGGQMNPKLLPTILMIIDFGAAMPYFFSGDWKRGVYWIAAGVLTWSVTY